MRGFHVRKETSSAQGDHSEIQESPPPRMLVPLALAQFLASFAASSMNVAISDITRDLETTVTGVQTVITFFTLTMAALMLPGSKLTDIWGRKNCFVWGLIIYGAGALLAAAAQSLGTMIVGYSLLEGIGSALMIPPIYVLTTISFRNVTERARAFAVISAMAALGAAAGPLIGGVIISGISWRATFLLKALLVVLILISSRRIVEPKLARPKPGFDLVGTLLSGMGLACIVLSMLQAGASGLLVARKDVTLLNLIHFKRGDASPALWLLALAVILLLIFFIHIHAKERKNQEPLISPRIFQNRTSNLGLITQNIQWFIMIGGFFIISVYLQLTLGYNAVETGAALTPATLGIILASTRAGAMARKFSQRTIIRAGFLLTVLGMLLLVAMVNPTSTVTAFIPGLLMMGLGIGVMLTASVNVVQSSFPEEDQGEISGLSRSVSNLGSSFGTAIAGGILIAALSNGITRMTNLSPVINEPEKERIKAALEHDFSVMSDNQVRQILQGQDPELVAEVARINAVSRNRALGFSLIAMAVIGMLGFLAALFLPPEKKESVTAPFQGAA